MSRAVAEEQIVFPIRREFGRNKLALSVGNVDLFLVDVTNLFFVSVCKFIKMDANFIQKL